MTNSTRSLIYRLKPLSLAIGLTLFTHTTAFADSNYGPIAQGETLSKIVSENYLVSQYSDAIIMREIFRENPEAFIANNMGLLKQGVNLVLPDDNRIRRSLASQGVTVQTQSRPAAILRSAAEAVASSRTESSSSNAASSGRLITVQESLRLVRAERDGLKTSLSASQDEVSDLKSNLASVQQRLSELEKQGNTVAAATVAPATDTSALTSLEESLNQVRGEREAAKAQLAEITSQLDAAKVSLETAKSTESTLKSQLDAALTAESELKEKLVSAQAAEADLTTQLAKANDELSQSQQAVADKVKELSAVNSQGSSQQSAALIEAEITKQNLEKSNALIVEKNEEIAALKLSIDDLQKQLESQPKPEPVKADTPVENNANLDAAEKTIAELELQIVSYQDEVKELQSQNDDLVNELLASAPADGGDLTMEIDPLVADGLVAPTEGVASISNDSIAGTNDGNFFTKSLVLPTWSALLALLLLGLTTLLFLLARRKQVEPVVANNPNDVVFKSGNLDNRDEDVEALRVPPRRDPSRVAILDPSMSGELVTSSEPVVSKASDVDISESQKNDSDLKLAMAEAYMELSDTQAANELLHEVLLEGNSQQQSSAELLMTRLAS